MSSIRGVDKKSECPTMQFLTVRIHQKLQQRSNFNLGRCEKTLGFQTVILLHRTLLLMTIF